MTLPLVPDVMALADVLEVNPSFAVAVASDSEGVYLVVRIGAGVGTRWFCAPATEQAISCVRSGRSGPRAVLIHSATGTVEVYRASGEDSLAHSTVLCSQLRSRPLEAA